MVGLALSITLGGVVILHLPQLPALGMLSMLVPVALFGITMPGLRVLSGFVLGLWLTAVTATREMDLRIPTGPRAEMEVIGMVTGLPSIKINFKMTHIARKTGCSTKFKRPFINHRRCGGK